ADLKSRGCEAAFGQGRQSERKGSTKGPDGPDVGGRIKPSAHNAGTACPGRRSRYKIRRRPNDAARQFRTACSASSSGRNDGDVVFGARRLPGLRQGAGRKGREGRPSGSRGCHAVDLVNLQYAFRYSEVPAGKGREC